MNGELPEGWAHSPVAELFRVHGGGTPDRGNSAFWNGGIPWLSSGDIKTSTVSKSSETITQRGLEKSAARLCRRGSVLVVVRSGILKHTLPVALLGREAAINQDIKAFDSGDDQLNAWLALAWRASARELLAENREGTTVQSVKLATLQDFELPIPPSEEQKRIVAKLEELLARVDACQGRLAKVPALLKRFRQSVLDAACSGRLTEDWREKNSAKDIENAKDLPIGWFASSVGDVIENLKYGTSTKCSYDEKGVPVLRIPNVVSGKIDQGDLKFARLSARELDQLRLVPGDILLIRSNGSVALVGRSAIVAEAQKGFAYAGYLIRLRPNRKKVEAEFLNLALASYDIRFQIELEARSTSGVNNINSEEVSALQISLPPLSEQHEIIQRVEKLFALADQIEARFLEAKKRVDSIAQSILAKAFSGELVPTEYELAKAEGRSFESAEELLKRVKGDGKPKQKTAKRKVTSTSIDI